MIGITRLKVEVCIPKHHKHIASTFSTTNTSQICENDHQQNYTHEIHDIKPQKLEIKTLNY